MLKLTLLTAASIFTAEAMFGAGSYDLQGRSLKDFLLPWSQGPVGLDGCFQRERDAQPIFLTPPESSNEVNHPLQMRFGTELDWDGQPSTFLIF